MDGKKTYRFNWIDALVCLLVAFLAVGAFYKLVVSDRTSAAGAADTITYTVLVQGVKEQSLDAVRVGDALYDSDSGNQVGVVTAVDVEPALQAMTYRDGTAHWCVMDGRRDLYLTVEAQGVITDKREYLVNRTYQVNVGSERNMNTQYRSFLGVIWSLG